MKPRPIQKRRFNFAALCRLLALAAAATVIVQPQAGFILNPSFESNYNDTWPHYGPIDSWAGGSGVNDTSGPFHNSGTPIPDQTRAAFMQGSGKLSQDLSGLTPGKQYWIQFFYDARGCCGGTIDLKTKFNDVELDKIANVKPVTGGKPYNFRSVSFKPDTDAGTLTFETVASGDATALVDAVTLVQRDEGNVIVMNPSFEASGDVADTGVLTDLAGWNGTGVFGVNVSGAGFANNGAAPSQDHVAFLQGDSSIAQTVPNLSAGKTYQLTFAYNASTGKNPHLQVKIGDKIVFEEDVTAVGGAAPYKTKTVSFTATDISAGVTFAQTKADQTLLIDDVTLLGESQKPLPPLGLSPNLAEIGPGQTQAIQVTVPAELLAIRDATLTFASPNQAIATLVGADTNGMVSLHFTKGGTNVQSFTVQAVARGVARIDVVDSAGLTVADDATVNVVSSFVRNSSFESSPAPGGIGTGEILAWTGGTGLNTAAGPFQDNGLIPDRQQVAFIQGSKTLSQQITGLAPGKNYWLQFQFNARNCCGGTVDLTARFDGKDLVTIPAITAVGDQNSYNFQNVEFTPAKSSGLLEFSAKATGDATVLLDAVSIVQRDAGEIVVRNPSFEATGSPSGVGYVQPNLISGWDLTGGYGINITGVGPFTDNGAAPDQDRVLFLQGKATASQLISGLTAGKKYTLIYSFNARNCCGGGTTHYIVSVADQALLEEDVQPVGANDYMSRYLVFTAQSPEALLKFEGMPDGDHTLLLDNIRIAPGEVKAPPPAVPLAISVQADKSLLISWPAAAADFVLESADTVTGQWRPDNSVPQTQGDQFTVTASTTGKAKFYRLRKG